MNESDFLEEPYEEYEEYEEFAIGKGFIPNKLHEKFKNKYYKIGQGWLSKTLKFYPSEIKNIQYYSTIDISISIFFCVSFYLLLTAVLLIHNTVTIILLALVYFFGSIIQLSVVAIPQLYHSRYEFKFNMEKVLNSSVNLKLLNENGKKEVEYPVKYVTDITGELNIPKDIKYAKIGTIQCYCDKDLKNFIEQYKFAYGQYSIIKELYYDDELLTNYSNIYSLNSSKNSYSINCCDRILCLFFLQWIKALCDKFSSSKCVFIYPVKLITKNNIISNTNIYIHGERINVEDFIYVNMKSKSEDKLYKDVIKKKKEIEELKKEKQRKKSEERKRQEEKRRIREERREREKRLEENTEDLSEFRNENYAIRVQRIYNQVRIYLTIFQIHENYKRHEIDVGDYEPYSEEYEEDIGDTSIYYPKGKNIKIQVTNYARNYTIKIGNKFTGSYNYYNIS